MSIRKTLLGCFIALAALQVVAAGIGLKPGLWETRIVKQTRDGKDMTAQVNGAIGQMQERLANLPPEQREKIEAMMKEHGGGSPAVTSGGAIQMCITAQQARQDTPPVEREGCKPSSIKRDGNHSTFEFSCMRNGTTTTGKGESTVMGNLISMVMDLTTQRANGDMHIMHSETEMKFVSADCGAVKPMTAPAAAPPHAAP